MTRKNIETSVKASELSVKFGDFTAVDAISFSVKSGEIFGFLGANGAGKTTTIRVLTGLLLPTSGQAEILGIGITPDSSEAAGRNIKTHVGYMSQRLTLYNDLTVQENLDFAASLRRLTKKEYEQRRQFLLKFISYQYSMNIMVRDLSAGTKQQISLASTLLHDPQIIFLDEPTAGVSPATRALFWQLIRDLASTGKTVFVTTHYMDEAENCDRIALMDAGKIIALDAPAVLKKSTFPHGLYEFEPKIELKREKIISDLRSVEGMDYFEPFGLRYHVAFKSRALGERWAEEMKSELSIQKINPTLEDVFIRTIEGAHV